MSAESILQAVLEIIAGTGIEVIGLIASPSHRTYWPFMLAAIPFYLLARQRDRRSGLRLPDHLRFGSAQTWFGRSAINDYWLFMINAVCLPPLATLIIDSLPEFGRLARDLIGHSLRIETSSSAGGALSVLLALVLFIADDFARYILHWAEHRVPLLWRFHKIHHSATELNLVTAERHHPVGVLWFRFGQLPIVGVVNWLFVTLFGDQISTAQLLGANSFWILANLLGSPLRHSPVWVSFGPRIERWLISPAQHQIHHSDLPAHFDRNFGSTLAIWDRLFGTLYLTTQQREPIRYGIGPETREYSTLWEMFVRPFRRDTSPITPRQELQ
jgi:sterol desaturase/sphingolipid hydroxylase (fatty acid hydroxylase superfamily)